MMRSLLLALLVLLAAGCGRQSGDAPGDLITADSSPTPLSQRMGGSPDPGFARAFEPRPFDFPRDHGPHPEFATEWWYFTGNLFDDTGRRFGYQFTLFRVGLEPGEAADDSDWRTHQLYMGHLAVSDVAAGLHRHAERFSRAAAGLAGAVSEPLRVWLGPWRIDGAPTDLLPLTIEAAGDDFDLALTVSAGSKGIVLQGEQGLSRKSSAPGNASYYYSLTRLPTRGRIRIGEAEYAVAGNSWFDREWSSSALGPDQAGWDWFALQLDDGRDLMFYRMRDKSGHAQVYSKGVLVSADGRTEPLDLERVSVTPLRSWTSPAGVTYPVDWRLESPEFGLDLQISAAFDDQEMDTTVRYWEGAVDVSGSHGGIGYLEMSGYGGDTPDR